MKKGITFGLTGLMVMTLLTGCGGTKSKYLLDVDYSKYVKLCDYKGVEVELVDFAAEDKVSDEVIDQSISEEEVEGEIEELLYDYTEYNEITDRDTLEVGDYVNIIYTGTIDGAVANDYSGEDDIPLGQDYFYPEVEEQMMKQKVGDTFESKVALDEDLAMKDDDIGKELTLKVTINSISEEVIPEFNDAFVKENTDYDSVEEYTKDIKNELFQAKKEEYKSTAVSEVMDQIIQKSEFDGYPQEVYDLCEKDFNASNEAYASNWGMETEEFLELMGMDEAACKEAIEENVKYELVFGAIAIAEGIDCTESEINRFAEENYVTLGYETKEDFTSDYSKEDIGYMVLCEKVSDKIFEYAKKNLISEEEYLKQVEAEEAELYDDEEEVELNEGDEEDALIEELDVEEDSTLDTTVDEKTASEDASTEAASEENSTEEASTQAETSAE